MPIKLLLTFVLLLSAAITFSTPGYAKVHEEADVAERRLQVGAAQFEEYLPLLEGKRVTLVVNQSSIIKNSTIKSSGVKNSSLEPIHLVDALLSRDINVVSIMSVSYTHLTLPTILLV